MLTKARTHPRTHPRTPMASMRLTRLIGVRSLVERYQFKQCGKSNRTHITTRKSHNKTAALTNATFKRATANAIGDLQAPAILVYGASGALGSEIVTTFKRAGWRTIAIDFFANNEADSFIQIARDEHWKLTTRHILAQLEDFDSLNAIVVTAGGWSAGSISSDALFDSVDNLFKSNVLPAIAAGHIAASKLQKNGMLALTGSAAIYHRPFPDTIGYGLAKSSIHQLVRTLAAATGKKELPSESSVIGIMPHTIDTPANRSFAAPETDFGSWTPPQFIAEMLLHWNTKSVKNPASKHPQSDTKHVETEIPHAVNGALYELITGHGKTTVKPLLPLV